MKKIIYLFIAMFLISFISASEQAESFSGGEGQYLVSSVPSTIDNSPFRYKEPGRINPLAIAQEGKFNNFYFIIPLILISVFLICFLIFKKEKIKNLKIFNKKSMKGEK